MRAALLCVFVVACSSAPRLARVETPTTDPVLNASPIAEPVREEVPIPESVREIALPPIPPLAAPDPSRAPASGRIERDSAVADRFTAEKQRVEYAFDARAGELSLFSLMTWGYARGWRSRSQLSVIDDTGRTLASTSRAGEVAWFEFLAFVAPHEGTYRFTLELEEGWYRYRLVRNSSYRAHLPGADEEIGAAARVDGYLASSSDEVGYKLHVASGERVELKVESAEEDGRKEQRYKRANVLHPAYRLDTGGSFAVLAAGSSRDVRLRVRTQNPGSGGRFVLVVERNPPLFALTGCVVDRDDRLLPGVELEFLRGADRDPLGTARTDAAGNYSIELPTGPYEVHLKRLGVTSPQTVECTVLAARKLDLMWLDEALAEERRP